MTTDNELDNPTEWGSIIGTAILHPDRRAEMERRSELKIACSHAVFCRCQTPLDQATAYLIKIDGRAAGVLCGTCFMQTMAQQLDSASREAGAETVRANIRRGITARTWQRDYTGAEILALLDDASPQPRKKSTPKKPPAAFSPQEIADQVCGVSETVWCFYFMVLKPSAKAQEKLQGKRYKSSPTRVAQGLHFLSDTKRGNPVFKNPEKTEDNGQKTVELTDGTTGQSWTADARKLLTVERNTDTGGTWYSPTGTNSPLVYQVSGETVAVLMPLD